jgi:hypothetical protein
MRSHFSDAPWTACSARQRNQKSIPNHFLLLSREKIRIFLRDGIPQGRVEKSKLPIRY